HLTFGRDGKRQPLHDEWLQTAIEFKFDREKEFWRCDVLGIPRPAPVPHPDDIVINMNRGTVQATGRFRWKKRSCGTNFTRERKNVMWPSPAIARFLLERMMRASVKLLKTR